ncbi:MAG TPA: ATP-binding cassette domain-containing protein [Bacteroidota bacterium]|jgi:cell division transport system ATP-binding protein|nr:ATP-binding cassette domain-containing protein [Bacteroidota bacterium]
MIDFDRVSVSFDDQPILINVSMHVKEGEFISLVGETGVGKTTLLRLIYFDMFPEIGTVTVGDYNSSSIRKKDIPKLRRTLGIVFQDFKLLEDRNVYSNIAFALQVTGIKRSEIGKRVLRVLADVGLSHKRNNMPLELSGGEQQRVGIARALVNKPLVLLADEPTGNLDPATSMEILQLLKQINATGTAVILATHNYELVRRSESRIIQIKGGRVAQIERV